MADWTLSEHTHWMRLALQEAERARELDEVPVGAVVVDRDLVVGTGFNQPIGAHDPTAHAEIVALRRAAERVGNYRLTTSALYVTVEPCLMCAGAIVHARVRTLVYGADEPKAGAIRSVMRALDHPALNHRVEVVDGVLEAECGELIRRFFQAKREIARVTGGREPEA